MYKWHNQFKLDITRSQEFYIRNVKIENRYVLTCFVKVSSNFSLQDRTSPSTSRQFVNCSANGSTKSHVIIANLKLNGREVYRCVAGVATSASHRSVVGRRTRSDGRRRQRRSGAGEKSGALAISRIDLRRHGDGRGKFASERRDAERRPCRAMINRPAVMFVLLSTIFGC